MSETLRSSWDHAEFERMKDDGVMQYEIEWENGRTRTTPYTFIAYFARLDPEATVREVEDREQ